MKCHLTWYCSILLQCCCRKCPCGFARNKFGFANHLWSQRKLLGHFRDLQAAQMPQWLVVSPVMKDLIVAIPWRFCSTTKLDIDSSWDASYLHCNSVNRKEIEVSGTSVRCHNPYRHKKPGLHRNHMRQRYILANPSEDVRGNIPFLVFSTGDRLMRLLGPQGSFKEFEVLDL